MLMATLTALGTLGAAPLPVVPLPMTIPLFVQAYGPSLVSCYSCTSNAPAVPPGSDTSERPKQVAYVQHHNVERLLRRQKRRQTPRQTDQSSSELLKAA